MGKGMTKAERAAVLADLNQQIRRAAELANKQMDNFLFSADIPSPTQEQARNYYNQRVYQSEHILGKGESTPDWVSTGYRPRFSGRKAKSITEARNRLARIEQVRGSYYSKSARADYFRQQREYWGNVFDISISKKQWDAVREAFDAAKEAFLRAGISSEEALEFCMTCAAAGLPASEIINAAAEVARQPYMLQRILQAPESWRGLLAAERGMNPNWEEDVKYGLR